VNAIQGAASVNVNLLHDGVVDTFVSVGATGGAQVDGEYEVRNHLIGDGFDHVLDQ
jgi:hypothetical protein